MTRTAYHRAYYYANLDRRRASARAARRKAREWRAVARIVSEAVTEARNDKPPVKGVDAAGVLPYASIADQRDGSLMDCSSPVNHPTTPNYSGMLDGETTRSRSLNSDRGGGPLNAQRVARKREPQRGNP